MYSSHITKTWPIKTQNRRSKQRPEQRKKKGKEITIPNLMEQIAALKKENSTLKVKAQEYDKIKKKKKNDDEKFNSYKQKMEKVLQ